MSLEHNGLQWIEAYVQKRIDELHLQIEAVGIDENTTNIIRGRIQESRGTLEDAERAYRSGV